MNTTLIIVCLVIGLINISLMCVLIGQQQSMKDFISEQMDYTENNIKTRIQGIVKVFGDMYAVVRKSIDHG